jgi:hypothetical protein
MRKHSPFRYFKTLSEIIGLAVMLYIPFPLSHVAVAPLAARGQKLA